MLKTAAVSLTFVLLSQFSAWADESAAMPPASKIPSAAVPITSTAKSAVGATEAESDSGDDEAPAPVRKTKLKGGKRTREKDADGTEAPNRFQADTVIKSQYKLNGQPLEVDPD